MTQAYEQADFCDDPISSGCYHEMIARQNGFAAMSIHDSRTRGSTDRSPEHLSDVACQPRAELDRLLAAWNIRPNGRESDRERLAMSSQIDKTRGLWVRDTGKPFRRDLWSICW